ncbi:hypothetical protein SLEP1_g51206 [Rubroshorea leprosula]|uniref:NYN domain-containing protein n=1 Tax=Rubroshorea leprosula TaxID=152421 RepID=A0AAV5M620_9ROSI|nr:hypothetical protein SLEP1_g51206 [Rubroshorea leprosula]
MEWRLVARAAQGLALDGLNLPSIEWSSGLGDQLWTATLGWYNLFKVGKRSSGKRVVVVGGDRDFDAAYFIKPWCNVRSIDTKKVNISLKMFSKTFSKENKLIPFQHLPCLSNVTG